MKTTALLVFFFFFIHTTFPSTLAEVVLDSDGEPLRNGGKYYFSPPAPIGGASIISAAIRRGQSEFCSLAVIQARYTNGWGTIISSPLKAAIIATTYPLNISFAYLAPNICTDSPNWVVTRNLPVGEPVMVGSAHEFGASYVNGWFYIKPYNSDKMYYKLVFCHSDQCGNIGVHIDSEERRRLVVTDEKPLVFKFDKVKESFASDLSMVV